MATPFLLHRLSTTISTQADALALFMGSPVLVVADRQTAGRGRSGRSWETAPRAVAASLAWLPSWPRHDWPRLTSVAGLAARTALSEVLGAEVGIKWPNDLVTASGKVAGLLIEVFDRCVVAGFGLNLWWADPPQGYAGLLGDDPGPDAAEPVAVVWASDLLSRVSGPAEAWGRAEYEEHCVTLGKMVRWQPDGRGRAIGVAPDGSLAVETRQGIEHLMVSEVWELRSTGKDDDQETAR